MYLHTSQFALALPSCDLVFISFFISSNSLFLPFPPPSSSMHLSILFLLMVQASYSTKYEKMWCIVYYTTHVAKAMIRNA